MMLLCWLLDRRDGDGTAAPPPSSSCCHLVQLQLLNYIPWLLPVSSIQYIFFFATNIVPWRLWKVEISNSQFLQIQCMESFYVIVFLSAPERVQLQDSLHQFGNITTQLKPVWDNCQYMLQRSNFLAGSKNGSIGQKWSGCCRKVSKQCIAPTWSSSVEALIGAQARKARHKPNPPKPSKWQTRFKIRLCRTKRPWIFCQILFKIHQTENRNCVKPSSCSISRLHEPNVSEVSCTSNNRWRHVYK